ncbi:hypothetical protein DRJ48_00470 [Candidatus Woesearchaeota archaeon]|nr:hypothetical protein [Candidatus Woesearchaeota archaeon]RLE43636.1 MAG: hypothetical protein DRJ48_00470 [Candidatus Woesearchaeota archaeon]
MKTMNSSQESGLEKLCDEPTKGLVAVVGRLGERVKRITSSTLLRYHGQLSRLTLPFGWQMMLTEMATDVAKSERMRRIAKYAVPASMVGVYFSAFNYLARITSHAPNLLGYAKNLGSRLSMLR